jgi:Fe2+ transport system protein FeoA
MNEVDERITPLAELLTGERARIIAMNGGTETEKRLSDMGLALDSEIEVLVAGNRSPLLVAAGETRLAIELDLAKQVRVRRFGGPYGRRGWGRRHHGRGRRFRR